MNPFNSFLEKFQKYLSAPQAQKKQIQEIIKALAKIELKDNELEIRDHQVILKTSPAVKSEIYMRKTLILKALAERNSPIKEIR